MCSRARAIRDSDLEGKNARFVTPPDLVALVEWADKVPACLPAEHLEIRITIVGEQTRRADITAYGKRYEEILRQLPSV